MELDHRNGKKEKQKGYRYIYIHRKTKYKDISRAKEDINAYEAVYDTRIYR